MATVHRALDTRLGRSVAVKLLRREVIEDADIAMRFRREALAATVLRHPNIVACLETGTDDGQPYLVMELIEGEDLAARLRRGRSAGRRRGRSDRPRRRARARRRPRPRHRPSRREAGQHPARRATAGRWSPTSASPASPPTPRARSRARRSARSTTSVPSRPRARRRHRRPTSYSLGLVLYEALTGRRAWSGDTTAAARGRPDRCRRRPSPRAVRPDVPAALDAIVVRALDPDPARRYPNGNAMAAALEPFVLRPDPASPTVAYRQRDAWPRAPRQSRRLRSTAAVAGALAPPLHTARCRLRPAGVSPGPARLAGHRGSAARAAGRGGGRRRGPVRRIACPGGDTGGWPRSPPRRRDRRRTPAATADRPPTAGPTVKPTTRPDRRPRRPRPQAGQPARRATCAIRSSGSRAAWRRATYEPVTVHPADPVHARRRLVDSVLASHDLIGLDRQDGWPDLRQWSRSASIRTATRPQAPRSARRLVESFIDTDGVAARQPNGEPGRQATRRRSSTWRRPARIGWPCSARAPDLLPRAVRDDPAHRRRRRGRVLVIAIEPAEATRRSNRFLPAGRQEPPFR